MTKNELESYQHALIKLRESHLKEKEELVGHIHNSQRESDGDLSAYSIHLADVAAGSYEREKDMVLFSDVSNILYEIDEALYRIEKGVFGICEACHQEIIATRLSAIPYARLCINCKKDREGKKK